MSFAPPTRPGRVLPCIAVLAAVAAAFSAATGWAQQPQAETALWLDLPFIAQPPEGCGAASLAMVMEYWHGKGAAAAPPPVAQIFAELHRRDAGGIPARDMASYLEKRGFRVFTLRGEWQDVEQHIRRGRPLIVALQPAGGAPRHYLVVAGFDRERGLVLVNDPAERKLLKRERAEFERQWAAAGNWTLLAVPAQSAAR